VELSLPLGALIVGAGVAVGLLSALFGVGGGLVMVPFMVLALGRSQHSAEGTSLLVIVPTAIAGVIAHAGKGFVSFKHAAFIALGGIGSAFLGAALALQLAPDVLQKTFGAFIVVMGARMAWQGRRSTGGDDEPPRPARTELT
jgi:uncharacterized protein